MSYKEDIKNSFKRVFDVFNIKKHIQSNKEELDALENLTSFVEEEKDKDALYEPEGQIIKEGKFSENKALKKKADKVKGINLISLPLFLKRDCETNYSYVKLLIHYLIAFLTIVVIGWVFKLKLVPIGILCLIYLFFGPSLIYFHYRKKYEKNLFSVCSRYIEQMLYSFTRKSKVLIALQEARIVIDGKLGKAIDFAINKIQTGNAVRGELYATALKEIEAILPSSRISNLHDFLVEVENVGGKHSTALDIMLEDVREWDVRTNEFQENQAVKGMGMLLSIIMSLGTCWFMSNILPADMGGDISAFGLYQWLTTISLIVMFFIYRVVARKLTRSWIADDVEADQEQIIQDCDKIKAYFETNKGVKPVLAMQRIKTELEKKFPRWVMRFSLLASSQSIPSALRNSVDGCPNVIRNELEKLIKEIDENPTGIEPYLNFFGYIEVPEVRSMMLMIYSLSEYGTEDIDKHVLSIVKRNYMLQANSEKISNNESLARFSLYVTAPMILACVIMMIDVAMIVLNMITMVSADISF